jgi:hypothetical protein
MFEAYVDLVESRPFAAAFLQFAVLGMLGEYVSCLVRRRRLGVGPWRLLGKMAAWGVLGLVIKMAFTGFDGFTRSVFDRLGLSTSVRVAGLALPFALAKSAFTNTFFGPQMMLFHRWEDNLVMGDRGNYRGMRPAIATLFWFWIPAHTVTFLLHSDDLQITLAALWSVVLGLILGLAHRG